MKDWQLLCGLFEAKYRCGRKHEAIHILTAKRRVSVTRSSGELSRLFSFVSCEDYNAISRSRRSFHRLTVIVKPGKYIVYIRRSGLRTTLSKILFQLNSVASLVFTIEGDYIV